MIARTFAAALLAASLAFTAAPVRAQENMTLSPKQVEAVKKVVRDYLMEHPEVLGEALEALREKMRAQAESDAQKMMEARKDDIFQNPDDPVGGNLKGDVVVVEFFDYNCGFCKQTFDSVWETIRADGKVKLVMKELPILGPDSVLASRVALVAKSQSQAKYDEVHRAFMRFRGRLDEKAIFRLAGESGMNVEQLKKDMASPDIDRQLKKVNELARSLEVAATPTFIVGDRILGSALDQPTLKQLIDNARKAQAKKG
ncbi:protein-disulfide isomerase [Paramagnetospirillum kuznetsovii]|uniref:Protein-disulfide isomerase n=1 Tax=Paramagnetospirillum kuznetsovii TaxID=2053833 RepID=A0A364NVS0_9PROT|nr:DsbA family protein [Paramagnetospirillum kuznetsovii]RAU20995.1 protein-disulfide isomerase [Paramagnetospirillum kuznetsovii]